MNATGIEWTGFSANPVKYRDKATGKDVWACVKHSPGCAHCYSEALALRFGRGGPFSLKTIEAVEPYLCAKELGQMLRSRKVAGKKVFVGDMTDVFGDWVPDAMLDKLFAVMALRPDVTFQVLTKRAGRMARYFNTPDENPGTGEDTKAERIEGWLEGVAHDLPADHAAAVRRLPPDAKFRWPLPNVWLGVSVENQAAADDRIPHLLTVPAAVRFLSCEPLLGPVDFRKVPGFNLAGSAGLDIVRNFWVIVGGESGPGARPMHPDWARAIRDLCQNARVPFFFKQWGEWADYLHARDELKLPVPASMDAWGTLWPPRFDNGHPLFEPQTLDVRGQPMLRVGKKAAGRLLDGRVWDEFPEPNGGPRA
jgi:protein gp37